MGRTGLNSEILYPVVAAAVVAISAVAIYFGFVRIQGDAVPVKVHEFVEEKKKTSSQPKEAPATFKMTNTEVRQVASGTTNWEVRASEIMASTKKGRNIFTGTSGRFFDGQGSMFTFTAPEAVYDSAGNMLSVKGAFTGRLEPEGHSITASDMKWEQKTRMVTASDAGITMDSAKATGKLLEIDTASRTVSLRGGVRIEIPLKKSE